MVTTPTFLPALGGAELVLLQVYRRLARRHSVELLTPLLDKKLLDEKVSVKIHKVDIKNVPEDITGKQLEAIDAIVKE